MRRERPTFPWSKPLKRIGYWENGDTHEKLILDTD